MRTCGVLLAVTSLPSPWGVGTLGDSALAWIDFLHRAGQGVWQMLPPGPTGYGDSPYQAFSLFAGNPYWIDLDLLSREGLLKPGEYAGLPWGDDPGRVDYGALARHRLPTLRRAFARFRPGEEYAAFCRREEQWLTPYAAFMAAKERCGGVSWLDFPPQVRQYGPPVLHLLEQTCGREMDFWRFVQYQFDRQWTALRAYARQKGVALMGDLPIYPALDSADVWAGRERFWLREDGTPAWVAGCPPDAFSPDGQLWGNPVYDWAALRREGYAWWTARMEQALRRFDRVRLDHFRGFAGFYAIPARAETAREGQWFPGPGAELFAAWRARFGDLPLVAEDLGFLTPEVEQLRQSAGMPGMKVLQFAFDQGPASPYLPHRYPEECVAYTGTHDNDTSLGFYLSSPEGRRHFAGAYLALGQGESPVRAMIRALMTSVAQTVIVPLQDYLELGSEARLNTPAQPQGNWCWRVTRSRLTPALEQDMARLAWLYERGGRE